MLNETLSKWMANLAKQWLVEHQLVKRQLAEWQFAKQDFHQVSTWILRQKFDERHLPKWQIIKRTLAEQQNIKNTSLVHSWTNPWLPDNPTTGNLACTNWPNGNYLSGKFAKPSFDNLQFGNLPFEDLSFGNLTCCKLLLGKHHLTIFLSASCHWASLSMLACQLTVGECHFAICHFVSSWAVIW